MAPMSDPVRLGRAGIGGDACGTVSPSPWDFPGQRPAVGPGPCPGTLLGSGAFPKTGPAVTVSIVGDRTIVGQVGLAGGA